MDDNRTNNHAKAVPLWVRQWHSREELATRFQVSERTINRRVLSGDIEREEMPDGTARFRPKMSAWTKQQAPFDIPSTPFDMSRGMSTDVEGSSSHNTSASTASTQDVEATPSTASTSATSGCHVEGLLPHKTSASTASTMTNDGLRHVEGRGELEQLRGDLEANHEKLERELQAAREEVTGELQDVRAMVEEVGQRVEALASVAGVVGLGELPEATESDSGEEDAYQRGEEDRGRERRQDLVWWRALLVSLLMKIKLWADRVMQRLKEKR